MRQRSHHALSRAFAAALVLLPVAAAAATAAEVEESRSATGISWAVGFEYGAASIVVSGPAGVASWSVPAGQTPVIEIGRLADWAKSSGLAIDGEYRYEIRFSPKSSPRRREPLDHGDQGLRGAQTHLWPVPGMPEISGHFRITGGAIAGVEPGAEETLRKDYVHADDVIVDGSLCVGADCYDDLQFGFDTIVLMENNLRVFFDDTSTIQQYAKNDWRLEINSTAHAGASYFAIQDATAGKNIATFEAGAPANSLYVEDYGRVGLGTSVPVVHLHIQDGNTPTVRLDQDGSAGWAPQRWDLAGNETSFFIRDVTNGSKLPLRIQPNTPSDTLTLRSDGHVGIGTWSPAAPLEVETTGESATLLLDRTDGGQWYLSATDDGTFTISDTGAPGGELLILDDLGNLTTSGTVNGISDRDRKTDFAAVDTTAILDAVASMSITSWSLKGDRPGVRHLGPTAQDFFSAFGLGADERHIALSDVGGVALAAIQALSSELEARDRKIADLERRLEALEKLLQ